MDDCMGSSYSNPVAVSASSTDDQGRVILLPTISAGRVDRVLVALFRQATGFLRFNLGIYYISKTLNTSRVQKRDLHKRSIN